MMGELILRNLLHRPLRTVIGVLAIAVEVALVVPEISFRSLRNRFTVVRIALYEA